MPKKRARLMGLAKDFSMLLESIEDEVMNIDNDESETAIPGEITRIASILRQSLAEKQVNKINRYKMDLLNEIDGQRTKLRPVQIEQIMDLMYSMIGTAIGAAEYPTEDDIMDDEEGEEFEVEVDDEFEDEELDDIEGDFEDEDEDEIIEEDDLDLDDLDDLDLS